MSEEATDKNFNEKVIEASKTKPVLVKFTADWCGPCRQIAPILEDIAGEKGDAMSLISLDTDMNTKTVIAYNVSSIPMMLLFVNGEVVKTVIGTRPKAILKKEFSPWLD